MKRNKIIYISGKYSGTPEQIIENIRVAQVCAKDLWEIGYTGLCPHLNTYHFEVLSKKLQWQDYIDGDLVLLKRCDAILMLPNWEDSKGACVEKEFAEKNNIPIFYDLESLEGKL